MAMKWLANLIYLALVTVLSPWLLYRSVTTGRYREGWSQKLLGRVQSPPANRPTLWLHAVSVGEVLQLPGIVSGWNATHPGWQIVITTTTTTGYSVASEKFSDCTVEYCPLDFSWAVENAIARFRPSLVGLVELELWPNLISCLDQHNVPVMILNGRLSAKSHKGYRKLRPLIGSLLGRFSHITVQNQEYAERFLDLGARPESLTITGSIKYDGVATSPNLHATDQMRSELGLTADEILFLAGSTHEPEEALALQAWQQLKAEFPQLRLAIAPRHAERFDDVAARIASLGASLTRRSHSVPSTSKSDVLLLDTLGELNIAWSMAHMAFVGGSFTKRGGQNMIEPAAYGIPVLVGPGTRNFAETVHRLKQANGLVELQTPDELVIELRRLLHNPELAQQIGRNAKAFVDSQRGATARIVELMSQSICQPLEQQRRVA